MFLDAGRKGLRRTRRRRRLALAGTAGLLLLLAAAGLVVPELRDRARNERRALDAQRLDAQALADDALDHSLLLARQGVVVADSADTRSAVLGVLARSPAAIDVTRIAAT